MLFFSKLSSYFNILVYGESSPQVIFKYLKAPRYPRLCESYNSPLCIVTDLRLTCILAYIHLKFHHGARIVLPSSSIISDYGDNTHILLRQIGIFLLRLLTSPYYLNINNQGNYKSEPSLGAMSSLASIYEVAQPSLDTLNASTWHKICFLDYSANIIANFVLELKPDLVIIFNGRVASVYNIARKMYENSIQISYLEFGRGNNGYRLFLGSPHKPGVNARSVVDLLNHHKFRNSIAKNIDVIKLLTQQAIDAKLTSAFSNAKIASTGQISMRKFDSVIFLGSEHEYCYIDEKITESVPNLNKQLIEYAFSQRPNSFHCVRFHPNSIHDSAAVAELIDYSKRISEYYAVSVHFDTKCQFSTSELVNSGARLYIAHSTVGFDILIYGKSPIFSTPLSDCQIFLKHQKLFTLDHSLSSKESVGLYQLLTEYANLVVFPIHYRTLHVILSPIFLLMSKLKI